MGLDRGVRLSGRFVVAHGTGRVTGGVADDGRVADAGNSGSLHEHDAASGERTPSAHRHEIYDEDEGLVGADHAAGAA